MSRDLNPASLALLSVCSALVYVPWGGSVPSHPMARPAGLHSLLTLQALRKGRGSKLSIHPLAFAQHLNLSLLVRGNPAWETAFPPIFWQHLPPYTRARCPIYIQTPGNVLLGHPYAAAHPTSQPSITSRLSPIRRHIPLSWHHVLPGRKSHFLL